ncbi:piggyBac transposable element-derived protein 4-like [Hyperolius riggenbachi]|uniref:piggyBac transposable element-derived protein 4-like n=1 Tax=Hyperolius riggenbachi TaxID=752182 RepID=UPI0035A348CC
MAKRLYTAAQAAAMLQDDSSSSSEGEEIEESDSDWLPSADTDSLSESDSESDISESDDEQPTSRGAIREERYDSDTDTAPEEESEGESPVAITSHENVRGQRAARPRQSIPARAAQLPYELSHPQWSPSNMEVPTIPPFTARSGILVDTANMQPIDLLSLFMPETFLQYICEQTNIYAHQRIGENPTSHFAANWIPTSIPELKVFLGLTFNMGLCHKPELHHYWSKDPIHCMPIYSATMPRRRYQMLLSCMHFVNNDEQLPSDDPAYDRLFKLRPLVNHFNKTFQETYIPSQQIAIDESLVPFHGRLGIKQYIPSKRSRYGVKLYKLCESGSGYTFSFKIYEGKDSLIEPAGCPPYMGTSERIVLDLLNPLLHQGYHLYVDNFYSSVPLFKYLFSAQTPACGTVRANRKGLPPQVLTKKLKSGETYSNRNNELLALKFKDKRDVFILTTIHSEATTPVVSRRVTVNKPVAIVDYNRFMGAVDLADQVLAPYRIDRKRKAWYKKVALYLMQVSIHNAFLIYKKAGNGGTFLKFQEQVITSLIFQSGQPAMNPDLLVSEDVIRLHARHFPAPLPPTTSKQHPQKRCKVCRRNGARRDTRYHCPQCPSKAALCLVPCFEVYHTVFRY